jgi:sulfur-oxidizing protein SoxZ
MARALISMPAQAKRGEVIEIKALVQHPMETGYRHEASGEPVPRDIINLFVCLYNGEEVFRAELFPAMAANPFLAFTTIATESGVVEFRWTDDSGETQTESRPITVA